MLYALICNGMNKSKWYEIERWNKIKGENVSWSPPIGPTAYWALVSAPWSGEPNPNTVGGPLSRSTHKRKVGIKARTMRFTGAAIPPTENPNPILKKCCQRRDVLPHRRRPCRSTPGHWTSPPRHYDVYYTAASASTLADAPQQRKARSLPGSTVTHREVIIDSNKITSA